MKFVKNDEADVFQPRVRLQFTSENTFGNHFNTGVLTDAAFQANTVTDGLAQRLAE